MKKIILLFTVICLFLNCYNNDVLSAETKQDTEIPQGALIKTINITSINSEFSYEIEDFDIENGYLYFDYRFCIYRFDLSLESATPELIIDDTNHAGISALAVINNTLYYQSFWESSSKMMKMSLDNISAGAQEVNLAEVFRGALVKKENELFYLSSESPFSAITNFYQLRPSSIDTKINSDQAVYMDYNNLKFIDDYLYFTSGKEIRKIDLNSTNEQSSIVYTIPELNHNKDGDIIGFDIQDNMVFYGRMSTNKLFNINLNTPNEVPKIIRTNTNVLTNEAGYTELIIKDGYLYAKKTDEDTIAVIKI